MKSLLFLGRISRLKESSIHSDESINVPVSETNATEACPRLDLLEGERFGLASRIAQLLEVAEDCESSGRGAGAFSSDPSLDCNDASLLDSPKKAVRLDAFSSIWSRINGNRRNSLYALSVLNGSTFPSRIKSVQPIVDIANPRVLRVSISEAVNGLMSSLWRRSFVSFSTTPRWSSESGPATLIEKPSFLLSGPLISTSRPAS